MYYFLYFYDKNDLHIKVGEKCLNSWRNLQGNWPQSLWSSAQLLVWEKRYLLTQSFPNFLDWRSPCIRKKNLCWSLHIFFPFFYISQTCSCCHTPCSNAIYNVQNWLNTSHILAATLANVLYVDFEKKTNVNPNYWCSLIVWKANKGYFNFVSMSNIVTVALNGHMEQSLEKKQKSIIMQASFLKD